MAQSLQFVLQGQYTDNRPDCVKMVTGQFWRAYLEAQDIACNDPEVDRVSITCTPNYYKVFSRQYLLEED